MSSDDPNPPSLWADMCEYRLRIADEAFRLNTVSPPPPKQVRDATTALGDYLGSFLSYMAVLIPLRVARRNGGWPR